MKDVFESLKKYSFWDGQRHKAGFERSIYLQKITQYLGNKLIKVLVGQRRVGKSYILRQIINFLLDTKKCPPQNIFYLNKEYLIFSAIKNAHDLNDLFTYYLKEVKPKGKIYILIDEVQNIQEWELFVNSYSQDFTGEYELVITGSNSNLLSGNLASQLSGRYVEFEVLPFGYAEFTDFTQTGRHKESFLNYLQTGGLPEMYSLDGKELKRNYIQSLKNTIVLRDIIQRHNIKDISLLEDIFLFLISNIGSLISFSSIIKYFKSRQKKTNYETVSSYVQYFTESFILLQAERYNLKGKKILGGERKYYLNDLAFKDFLLGASPTDIGFRLENLVYLELRRAEYRVWVGNYAGKEIDFVAEKAEKRIYVQATYLLSSDETIEREFGNLLKIKDNYEKFVVSMDDVKFSNYQGIKHISPWELPEIL